MRFAGSYTFRIDFNEPIDPARLEQLNTNDTFNLTLYSLPYGFTPTSVIPVLDNTAIDVAFTIPNLPSLVEGDMLLLLDVFALTDIYGNPGTDQFHANYTSDITTMAHPVPLNRPLPLGSLIATGQTLTGMVNPNYPGGGDTDDFTINLDGGQLLNVLVFPIAGGSVFSPLPNALRPRLEVYNAANVLVGSIDAPGAGQRIILLSLPLVTSGTYTLRVRGLDGTVGYYQLYVSLNTSLEEEGRLPGATNNSPATTQSLDPSFLTLSTDLTKSSCGAVIGTMTGAVDANPGSVVFQADFESGDNGFTLDNTVGFHMSMQPASGTGPSAAVPTPATPRQTVSGTATRRLATTVPARRPASE